MWRASTRLKCFVQRSRAISESLPNEHATTTASCNAEAWRSSSIVSKTADNYTLRVLPRRVLIFLPLPTLLAAVCDRVIFLAVLLILPRLPVTMFLAWLRHLAKLVTFAGPPVTLIRTLSIAFACRYPDASALSDIYYPLYSSRPVQITSPPRSRQSATAHNEAYERKP